MKRRFRLPSPALAISLIALFVALGGTSYAAITLPKNSVGTKQLKKNSVTSPKIKNRAVTAAKINTSGLTVPNAVHAASADSATNATSATTAANANALGGVGASSYVRNSGEIFVQLGHSNWAPLNNTDPIDVSHYLNSQSLEATATGGYTFRIDATIPTSLYGKALEFAGIQICYDATGGPDISEVDLYEDTESSTGVGTFAVLDVDHTARADAACRTYSPTTPVLVTPQIQFSLSVTADWSAANKVLFLGRATAILQPTSTAATG